MFKFCKKQAFITQPQNTSGYAQRTPTSHPLISQGMGATTF